MKNKMIMEKKMIIITVRGRKERKARKSRSKKSKGKALHVCTYRRLYITRQIANRHLSYDATVLLSPLCVL